MATKKVILKEIVDGVAGDSLYTKTSIDLVEGLEEALDAAGSVSTISVNNGTPIQPVNKNINITVPEDLKDLNEDSEHKVVTDTEKSTWNGKQDVLTFDSVPTKNSNNPIKSSGVYDSIFENKAYDPEHYSGLGKVVLEMNLVNGVNTLTQAMVNKANTIYVIQYDYVLGADITIPDNCVLKFEGGSISASGSNDTITGTNTAVEAGVVKALDIAITFTGTWSVDKFSVDWFGTTDFNSILAKIISTSCFSSYAFNKLNYNSSADGSYSISNSVNLYGVDKVSTINIAHQIQITQTAANIELHNLKFNFSVVNSSPFIHSVGGFGTLLNRCGWYNGGTFVKMGTTTTMSYNLRVKSSTRLILANAGKPLFELTNGCGFYMTDFDEIHHVDATTPSQGQTMNTVEGTDFLLVNGNWDTANISVFVEKLYNGISVVSPTTNRINFNNVNIHECIFDYVRNSAISIKKVSSFNGTFTNNHIFSWEGIGFDAKGYPGTDTVIIYNTKIINNKFLRSGEASLDISTGSSPSNNVIIANNIFYNDNANYDDKTDKIAVRIFNESSFLVCNNLSIINNNIGTGSFSIAADKGSTIYGNKLTKLTYGVSGSDVKTPYLQGNDISTIKTQGAFADKPTNLTARSKGFVYFDETNNKPIYWNGSAWVDATGATV